jgi:hypothetical protein
MSTVYIVTHVIMVACIVSIITVCIRSVVEDRKFKVKSNSPLIRLAPDEKTDFLKRSAVTLESKQFEHYLDRRLQRQTEFISGPPYKIGPG